MGRSDQVQALRVLLGLLPLIARSRFDTWRARRQGASFRDPRRVLFLASFWPGNAGYEYRIARWADVLQDAGFEVDIDLVFEHEQFWSWVRLDFLRSTDVHPGGGEIRGDR
jgi:hypothetical protein